MDKNQPKFTGENPTEYVYRAWFRATKMGGRDETYVFRIEREDMIKIEPKLSYRSRSGNHGEDEWHLNPGTYIVVSISRPNNRRRPYEVIVKRLVVESDGKAIWYDLFTEKIMDLDEIDYLIEKIKKMAIT
jgi:hypothetical protein